MADRTSNTTFYTSNDPTVIRGVINGEDGDTILLPHGLAVDVMVSSQDKDDAIVSADVVSNLITLGCVDDAGSAISGGNDFDIVFKAILKAQ